MRLIPKVIDNDPFHGSGSGRPGRRGAQRDACIHPPQRQRRGCGGRVGQAPQRPPGSAGGYAEASGAPIRPTRRAGRFWPPAALRAALPARSRSSRLREARFGGRREVASAKAGCGAGTTARPAPNERVKAQRSNGSILRTFGISPRLPFQTIRYTWPVPASRYRSTRVPSQ